MEAKHLLLPTIGTVGGVLQVLTGQWRGWVTIILSAALYAHWGWRYRTGVEA